MATRFGNPASLPRTPTNPGTPPRRGNPAGPARTDIPGVKPPAIQDRTRGKSKSSSKM